jgi:hypothetical protein
MRYLRSITTAIVLTAIAAVPALGVAETTKRAEPKRRSALDARAASAGRSIDRVDECSKDHWAMTYATFGLFYLASTRALGMEDPDQAMAELETALTTTSLLHASDPRLRIVAHLTPRARADQPGSARRLGSLRRGAHHDAMMR